MADEMKVETEESYEELEMPEEKGRQSLDEILRRAKAGRTINPGYVDLVCRRFAGQPISVVYGASVFYEEFREQNIELLGDGADIPFGEVPARLRRVNGSICQKDMNRLAIIMAGDRGAYERYTMRKPKEGGGASSGEVRKTDQKLNALYEKNVLPFLRLPVADYLEYLSHLPKVSENKAKLDPFAFIDYAKCYEECFRYEVELWEEKNGRTPTISDVLLRCWEVTLLESNNRSILYPANGINLERYRKGGDFFGRYETTDKVLKRSEQIPFQLRSGWAPFRREIVDAMTWAALLMVQGVIRFAYPESIRPDRMKILHEQEEEERAPWIRKEG